LRGNLVNDGFKFDGVHLVLSSGERPALPARLQRLAES
jgi:hypothetical protein